MSRTNRSRASVFAILLAFGLAIPALSAAADEAGAMSRLEARANDLAEQIHGIPAKGGTSRRLRLQQELRDVEREIVRLEQGGPVDMDRLSALLGHDEMGSDSASLAERAIARRNILERRLTSGPKLGIHGRRSVQEDIDRLNAVISKLEAGRTVDVAILDEALGTHLSDASRSASRDLNDHRVRLASLRRQLTGHKMGIADRGRVRHEIADLETTIARMENQPTR